MGEEINGLASFSDARPSQLATGSGLKGQS